MWEATRDRARNESPKHKMGECRLCTKNQSSRISNIEEQLHETKGVKQSVSKMQVEIADMGRNLNKVRGQMNQNETSMDHYNEQYENLISDKTRVDDALFDLSCQMKDLQSDYDELKAKQNKTESKVIDLQCRSMCENLIFSGIKEELQTNSEGTKYEDSESVPKNFLRQEMDITVPIEFDRVNRLGPIKQADPNQEELDNEAKNQNPRPIIAKFERYKDKQYVKMIAPKKLRNKPFGVNKQFPKEIEETRKTLYGEMKRAKRNQNNKVRLVRDKLFVNGVRIHPKSGTDLFYDERNRTGDQTYRKPLYRDSDKPQKSRVFYSPPSAGTRPKHGMGAGPRPGSGPGYHVDFTPLPSSSSYQPFGLYDNSRTPAAHLQNNRSVNGKKKAVSPLDEEIRSKRQKDLNSPSDSECSGMELSYPATENQLQHEQEQTHSLNTPEAQPSHHTNDIPDRSIQCDDQSGVNQSGVNSDNKSVSDI